MQRILILAALAFSLPALAEQSHQHTPVPMDPQLFGMWLYDGTRAASRPDPVELVPERMNDAWERFQSANPGRWSATWVRQSPSFVFGGAIPAPGAVRSAPRAAEAAKEILARHVDLLAPGASAGDFVLVANDLNQAGDYRTVGFEQRYRGLPVVGGHLSVRIKNDRIFALSSQAAPFVDLRMSKRTLGRDQAVEAAQRWIESLRGGHPRSTGVDGPMVLPYAREDGGLRFERVLQVELVDDRSLESWRVFLDAEDGQPVAREQLSRYIDGEVDATSPDGQPLNGRATQPVHSLTLQGQTPSVPSFPVQLDAQGRFSTMGTESVTLTNPAQPVLNLGDAQIRSGLSGPSVRVADFQSNSPTPLSGTVADGETLLLDLEGDEFDDATLNTYLSTMTVRDRLLELVPGLQWLVQDQVIAFSNVDDFCNAVVSQGLIFMFRSGRGCENTGLLDDVVFHEFGHVVHGRSLIRGVGSFAVDHSEGLSDYLAATVTDDSRIGEGIRRDNRAIRETDPPQPNTWSLVGGSSIQHTRGLAYGGAMWDLREALRAKLGPEDGVDTADLLWYETLRRANGIPSTFLETLAADDDDGDLSNGTPNFCEILEAFERHEILFTSRFEAGVGQLVAAQGLVSLPILDDNVTCGDAVTGATLEWTAEDGTSGVVPLELSGPALAGELPSEDAPQGQIIEYRVAVRRAGGSNTQLPDNPAAPFFQWFNGELEEFYCNDFENDPFAEGFNSELRRGNNRPGADDWQFGPPQGRSGDPSAAFSGDGVLGNDLGLEFPGGNAGNGAYQPGIANAIEIPTVEVEERERYILRYQRWLNVEDGRFDQATIAVNGREAWKNAAGSGNHQDAQWVEHFVDVTDLVSDGRVDVDFVLSSDDGLQLGGWTLDDLCVTGYSAPVCGNGRVEEGESCDDGNLDDGDGCEATCEPTPMATCGDGVVEGNEACDDGNQVDGDGCEATCVLTPEPECGNGVLEDGEACDDGNQVDGDGCEATCEPSPVAPVCGNGVIEGGEACDDANQIDGDGCDADCVITPASSCPDGSAPPCEAPGGGTGGGSSGSLQASEGGCSAAGANGGLMSALLVLGAFLAVRRRGQS